MRLWPVLTAFFLFCSFLLAAIGNKADPAALSRPGFISISLLFTTIFFFVAALYSIVPVLRAKNLGLKRAAFIPLAVLAVVQLLVALYLLWHGVVGIRMWA